MTTTKTVMVVDDEPHMRRIFQDRLEANKFAVLTAENGQDALAKIQQRPDVILLDVMMPIMDGYETLKNLKDNEKTKDIPVIMLTAKGDTESVETSYALGAVDYVVKPVNPLLLMEKINKALTKGK